MKKSLLSLTLFLSLSACSNLDPHLTHAIKGQSFDAATTAIGSTIENVSEANPAGFLGSILLKPVGIYIIDKLDEPERTTSLNLMGSVGYGIGASNLCVIISASSNLGLTTPLCLIVFGLSTFLINFNSVNRPDFAD